MYTRTHGSHNEGLDGAVAFVLYLAVKFEDAQDTGLNPAREGSCSTECTHPISLQTRLNSRIHYATETTSLLTLLAHPVQLSDNETVLMGSCSSKCTNSIILQTQLEPQKSCPCSPNTASTTSTRAVTEPQKSLPSSPN